MDTSIADHHHHHERGTKYGVKTGATLRWNVEKAKGSPSASLYVTHEAHGDEYRRRGPALSLDKRKRWESVEEAKKNESGAVYVVVKDDVSWGRRGFGESLVVSTSNGKTTHPYGDSERLMERAEELRGEKSFGKRVTKKQQDQVHQLELEASRRQNDAQEVWEVTLHRRNPKKAHGEANWKYGNWQTVVSGRQKRKQRVQDMRHI